MGFRISVSYDEAVLTSPKVTKGDLTEGAMMNDSIGVSPEGTFDVVWTSTQNATGDGTLMILSFTALRAQDTKISLSCSQPDTFNEAWEAVELKCSDIAVSFRSDGAKETQSVTQAPPSPTQAVGTTGAESSLPSDEEIRNAVDIVLGETDKGHIDEIPEEEKEDFVDRTNEILGRLTGESEAPFESFDEIKGAYNDAVAEEFIEDTKEAVDSDKIDAAIKDSLASVGVESVEQIPEEKKAEFVQQFEDNLAQHAPDVDTISDKLTADEAVEAIQQLQGENEVAATEGVKLPESQKEINTATLIIIIATLVAAAVTIVAVVCIKRKKNEEEK